MVPPFLPSYKNTARSLVWAVSLRKIGSPLLIFIMFPLYTVANNSSIQTLLSWIRSGEIAIPEIQRPFVWDSTKVRDFN